MWLNFKSLKFNLEFESHKNFVNFCNESCWSMGDFMLHKNILKVVC